MIINVPTTLADITLEQYQNFLAIPEDSDEDFRMVKMLEVFCGVDPKDGSKIPYATIKDICSELDAVLNEKGTFVDRFELSGLKWGFLPSIEDMTLGEFIDAETFVSDSKNYHRLAAVMFRPVTNEAFGLYNIQNYSANREYQEILKQMPLNVFSEALLFFYRIASELLTVTKIYSQEVATDMTPLVNLLKDMVGLTAFSPLPTGTQPNLKK
jgi:hypothetical protein